MNHTYVPFSTIFCPSFQSQNPEIAETYTEHSCQVNVAKYSPSGFYIASAGNYCCHDYKQSISIPIPLNTNYKLFLDQSGKVRIWDTVNKEHICKIELQPFAGPIKDLAWSPDNQRMVVVGEGREWYTIFVMFYIEQEFIYLPILNSSFGHVFLVDTGTSNGTIGGPSKPINSCDFRPARPFKIIAGSEDNSVTVFEGPIPHHYSFFLLAFS